LIGAFFDLGFLHPQPKMYIFGQDTLPAHLAAVRAGSGPIDGFAIKAISIAFLSSSAAVGDKYARARIARDRRGGSFAASSRSAG
jgi:hypothetical protein